MVGGLKTMAKRIPHHFFFKTSETGHIVKRTWIGHSVSDEVEKSQSPKIKKC